MIVRCECKGHSKGICSLCLNIGYYTKLSPHRPASDVVAVNAADLRNLLSLLSRAEAVSDVLGGSKLEFIRDLQYALKDCYRG